MLLGDGFEHFESLDSLGKASFVLCSELWEDDFTCMLHLVKDYIVDVYKLRKAKLNVPQSQSQNSSVELGMLQTVINRSQTHQTVESD